MDFQSSRCQEIKEKISVLLSRAEIPQKFIKDILDDSGVQEFEKVFRHRSYDETTNYEMDEFVGDCIVNLAVAKFVLKTFQPKNSGEATVTKHHIQANKLLGRMAKDCGLLELLLIRDTIDEKIQGDIFEGFIGCLFRIVCEKRMESTAYLVCNKVAEKLLTDLNLDKKEISAKDPVSQFKEKYVDYYRWGSIPEFIKINKEKGIVYIYGYPSPQVTSSPVLLVEQKIEGITLGEAKAKAAWTAIKVLGEKYHLPGRP